MAFPLQAIKLLFKWIGIIAFYYFVSLGFVAMVLIDCAVTLPLLMDEGRFGWKLLLMAQIGLTIGLITSRLRYVFVVAVAFWPTIILLEIVVDTVCTYRNRISMQYRDRARKVVVPGWESVAAMISSSHDHRSRSFYPATSCEFDRFKDPFWPDHASIIYMVEIRRRCTIWRQVVLWRVSLLHGGQKKVHEFDQVSWWGGCTDEFFSSSHQPNDVRCFQCADVVMITIRDNRCNSLRLRDHEPVHFFYIYDLRFGKAATYSGVTPRRGSVCVLLSCIGRLIFEDGSLSGWRIRSLEASTLRVDDQENETTHGGSSVRVCLTNTVYEFVEENFKILSREDIVFGRFASPPQLKSVRTSQNAFGVYAETSQPEIESSPTLLFNESTSDYIFFDNYIAGLLADRPFAAYFNALAPIANSVRETFQPTFLSDLECIQACNDGNVFRCQFDSPTPEYQTAKTIFQFSGMLKDLGVNAAQFEELFGIGGMEPHLE